jgi:flagellar basal body-associated protein FliL
MRTNAARKGTPALLLVIALVVLVSGSVAAMRLVVSSQHPPKITSFYPTVGTAGTVVTILGDFFESTDTVQFNAQRSTSVRIISTTQIAAIVPIGATTGAITINFQDGQHARSNTDFIVDPAFGAAVSNLPSPTSTTSSTPSATTTRLPDLTPTPTPSGGESNSGQVGLVPAYWTASDGTWDTLVAGCPPGSIVVANAGSGPGSVRDPQLAGRIAAAQAAGLRVVGYVLTSRATRPAAQVQADIDIWYQRYALDGVFLDDSVFTAAALPYYQAVHDHVKAVSGPNARGRLVVINAASTPLPGYMAAGDVLVVFEGTEAAFAGQNPTVPWMRQYPAGRFAAILTGTPDTAAMQAGVGQARARGIGAFYATDETRDQGPYNRLPVYWSAEVAALQAP